MAGKSPSKCTSTTAPSTCVILPTVFFAMALLLWSELDGLGAGDDLDQFLRDIRLPRAVVVDGQAVDHFPGVAGRAVHRGHARTFLAGAVLQQRLVDLHRQIVRQQ